MACKSQQLGFFFSAEAGGAERGGRLKASGLLWKADSPSMTQMLLVLVAASASLRSSERGAAGYYLADVPDAVKEVHTMSPANRA